MYFLDLYRVILQIFPPNWRFKEDGTDSPKVDFLHVILTPFKHLLNDFEIFRNESELNINLTAQVMVVENHIRNITGESYGVYVADTAINQFSVNVPATSTNKENEIRQFLNKVIPLGRNYTINFY